MLQVRSLDDASPDDFAAAPPSDRASGMRVLDFYLREESTKPSWCFVLFEDGRPAGRAGFWSFGLEKDTVSPFGIALPWDEPGWLEKGKFLLESSGRSLAGDGVGSVEARISSDAPQQAGRLAALYEASGFLPAAVREQYRLGRGTWKPGPGERLHYRSIEDIGEEELIRLIGEVSRDTKDRLIAMDMARRGPGAAESFMRSLKAQDFHPPWWLASYDAQRKAAGLVIAQHLGQGRGTVNYVGVVPPARGHGYGRELLQRGITMLFDGGLDDVVIDTDMENTPVRDALASMGFSLKRSTAVYEKQLLP